MTPIAPAGPALERLYKLRWPLSVALLLGIFLSIVMGVGRIEGLSQSLATLGDTTNGTGKAPPPIFDPRMDIWFGEEDEAVRSYDAIEKRFVAEDFVMLTFEENDAELGVFDPETLATISRLTAEFERVPGVRHVRSLTSNPWIRWDTIDGVEQGLVISDLVEGDPRHLSERELVERMVAVIGAERAASKLGIDRVRAVIGQDVELSEFIGEPRLLGTILDESATTTAIQVQVLRPAPEEEVLADAFSSDPKLGSVAPDLFSVQSQRAALRGIEHILSLEHGLSQPTDQGRALAARIAAQPEGEEKTLWLAQLADPTKAYVQDPDGVLVRKWIDYEPDGARGFVDAADGSTPAPADFVPVAASAYEFHVGGVPLFERNFEVVGMSDAKYMGAMFLVIAILLLVVFRGVAGVIAPLAVVFVSVGAMVGMAFSAGFLFNNLTMISPNMLTAVGIGDAVHLVAAWLVLRLRMPTKREAILETLRRNALPVLLTSITTAIGFLSLTVSGLEPVKRLGIMAGLGALIAYALSMTLVPAILSLFPHPKQQARSLNLASVMTPERSRRFVSWLKARGKPILVSAGALGIIALFGLSRVRVASDFRGMFPDDNEVMTDFAWIEDHMGGVGDLEIVFDGRLGGERQEALSSTDDARLSELRVRAFGGEKQEDIAELGAQEQAELVALEQQVATWSRPRIGIDPEFLGQLDRFEARLREEMGQAASPLSVVTDLSSPLDILRKMHQVQNENQASFYRTPGEQDVPAELRTPTLDYDEWSEEWALTPAQSGSSLIAQYYLQYENGAEPGENLSTDLSPDRTQFRMQGRVKQAPADVQSAAFARIQEIAREEFPQLGARVEGELPAEARAAMTVSGKTLLFARTSRVFAIGFVESMTIALVLITTLIGVLFRSWKLALTSAVPNVLPIVLPLSVFGLLGIPLDGPAILVSSVALGVCVDDTIHFFTKFVRARRSGANVDDSLAHVFEEAGAAVTLTSLVLIVGFGTLIFSDFSPNSLMGSLAAAMIGLAWLADFLVVPVLLRLTVRSETHATPSPASAETLATA